MAIRIGSSPTSVKLELTKGDRNNLKPNQKYMVTFHQDRFVFTPDTHSSFIKGCGNVITKLPNGTLILQSSKVRVIDPFDGNIDLPYFKIDHSSRIMLRDEGIVTVYLPEELKPIRRSMGEKAYNLPSPVGKPRVELPVEDQPEVELLKFKHDEPEPIHVSPAMDQAFTDFWPIYLSGATEGAKVDDVEQQDIRRAFMSGWHAHAQLPQSPSLEALVQNYMNKPNAHEFSGLLPTIEEFIHVAKLWNRLIDRLTTENSFDHFLDGDSKLIVGIKP